MKPLKRIVILLGFASVISASYGTLVVDDDLEVTQSLRTKDGSGLFLYSTTTNSSTPSWLPMLQTVSNSLVWIPGINALMMSEGRLILSQNDLGRNTMSIQGLAYGKDSMALNGWAFAEGEFSLALNGGWTSTTSYYALAANLGIASATQSIGINEGNASGVKSIAVSNATASSHGAIAINTGSYAMRTNSIAINGGSAHMSGSFAMNGGQATKTNSIALNNGIARGKGAIGIGVRSAANGENSIAINDSRVMADNSVGIYSSYVEGANSMALMDGSSGYNSQYAFAFGRAYADCTYSFAFANSVAGRGGHSTYSIAIANAEVADNSPYGIAVGINTFVAAPHGVAIGKSLFNASYANFVVGKYNDSDATDSTTPSDLGNIFEVGNGLSNTTRSNAITVLKNGQTILRNRYWNSASASAIPTSTLSSSGVALEVKGHSNLKGNLTVEGDVSFSGASSVEFSNAKISGLAAGSSGAPAVSFQNSTGGIFVPSSGGLGFATAGTHRLLIGENGNIGLGATVLDQKLVVNGNIRYTGYLMGKGILNNTISLGESTTSRQFYAGTGTYFGEKGGGFHFLTGDAVNGTEALRIIGGSSTNSGYVGIGAIAPSSRLTVVGQIEVKDDGTLSGGIKFPDGTVLTSAGSGGGSLGLLGVIAAIAPYVAIDSNDNIEIKKDTTISGNQTVSGNMSISGALTVTTLSGNVVIEQPQGDILMGVFGITPTDGE